MVNITKEAREIFGDILIKAETELDKNYWENKYEYSFENDFDGDTIILTFINGNIIEISNSEWGWIRKIGEKAKIKNIKSIKDLFR